MPKHELSRSQNLLILHTDQQRIECLGCYGNSDIRTPHIDSLARDGVRFENSFCPYPVCTPSRYSLITGMYVHEHRGWTNHCTLPPGTPTFPSLLREAGYATKAVGKMHYTPTYFDVGFQEMELAEQDGPGRWDDDYHRDLMENGLVDYNDLEDQVMEFRSKGRQEYWDTFGALASNLPNEFHTTTWIGDRAVRTVENWTGQGNLLMVGFVKPHHPFDPPAELADAYNPDRLTLLPGWLDACLSRDLKLHHGYFPHEKLTEKALRRVMAYYYATIEHIDMQVGRVLDTLRAKGLYDDTLIVFTSDHGEYLGYHHMLLKGNHLYEALARVPLLIKYPGNVGAGTHSHGLVNNVDVAPTVLQALGLNPATSMRGLDLTVHPRGSDRVFSETHGGAMAMVRTKDRKLLLNHKTADRYLFDLARDSQEIQDVSENPAYREDLDILSHSISAWRRFEELSSVYLDEDAPIIDRPNVPDRDDDHRRRIQDYFRNKMASA